MVLKVHSIYIMNIKKKTAAFTLTEMLIVLAISAIVAGLAFAVLQFITKNLNSIQNNYSEITKIRLLEEQITVDFNKYHDINFDHNNRVLSLKNPIDSIFYSFDDSILLRNRDTLVHDAYSKDFFFAGDLIQSGKVDAIKIEFLNRKIDSFIFIFKENDATLYMAENGY